MFYEISFFLSSLISKQLLDEVEQNIVIFQWQVDQLFSKAEGWGNNRQIRLTRHVIWIGCLHCLKTRLPLSLLSKWLPIVIVVQIMCVAVAVSSRNNLKNGQNLWGTFLSLAQ